MLHCDAKSLIPNVLSRRDYVRQPRVARNELPWVRRQLASNPNGVVTSISLPPGTATPLGLSAGFAISQGSSFLATLGYWSESLWDSFVEIAAIRCGSRLATANVADFTPLAAYGLQLA